MKAKARATRQYWMTLIDCIFFWDRGLAHVPGADLTEWWTLADTDYDQVDRLYIDAETIGAG